jgi:hypothetical protein
MPDPIDELVSLLDEDATKAELESAIQTQLVLHDDEWLKAQNALHTNIQSQLSGVLRTSQIAGARASSVIASTCSECQRIIEDTNRKIQAGIVADLDAAQMCIERYWLACHKAGIALPQIMQQPQIPVQQFTPPNLETPTQPTTTVVAPELSPSAPLTQPSQAPQSSLGSSYAGAGGATFSAQTVPLGAPGTGLGMGPPQIKCWDSMMRVTGTIDPNMLPPGNYNDPDVTPPSEDALRRGDAPIYWAKQYKSRDGKTITCKVIQTANVLQAIVGAASPRPEYGDMHKLCGPFNFPNQARWVIENLWKGECKKACPEQCPIPVDVNVKLDETKQIYPVPPDITVSPAPAPIGGTIGCDSVRGVYDILTTTYNSGEQAINHALQALGVAGPNDGVWATFIQTAKQILPTNAVASAMQVFAGVMLQAGVNFVQQLLQWSPCNSPEFITAQSLLPIVGFANAWTNNSLAKLQDPLTKIVNHQCPTEYPGPSDADALYVAGLLPENEWHDWLKYNNHCVAPHEILVQAYIERMTPEQAILAYRRGLLSEEEVNTKLERNGWKRSDRLDFWEKLTKPIPPITDILRFLVRDTADPNVVARFGTDALFHEKWQGEIVEWAKQQGITDDIARHYWRAHWSIPSPTQLFEMFHRSRGLPDGHPAKVRPEDIKEALVQQDILPFWIEPILNTTYSVMRLVDVRNAYFQGVVGDDEVRRQLRMRGYSDDDVETILKFYQFERQGKLLNHRIVKEVGALENDVPTLQRVLTEAGATPETINKAINKAGKLARNSTAVKDYIAGYLGMDALLNELGRVGFPRIVSESILRYARERRHRRSRRDCLAAIEYQYMHAVLDRNQAIHAVIPLVGHPDDAAEIVAGWECLRSARRREIPAATLCTWFEQGIITAEHFLASLKRLGYTDDDAWRVIASCAIRLGERQAKDLERLEQRLKKEQERQQKEAERRAAKAKAAEERRAAKLEQLRRLRERREQRMLQLKSLLAEALGLPVEEAGNWLLNKYKWLEDQGITHPDERLTMLSLAMHRYPWQDLAGLDNVVQELVTEWHQFENELGPSSANG